MAASLSDSDEDVCGLLYRPALVAAIDFGTTYSGVAFSLYKDYKKNRLDIQVATHTDARNTQAIKVPTAILFDPDEKFHSFGSQAEDKFAELLRDNESEARRWRYFHRFKMLLFDNETLSIGTELQDYWRTNTMPAIRVFSAAIRYFRDNVLRRTRKFNIDDTDIEWVITIPAIWNDKAKQFTRTAAVEAGIPNTQLVSAFEPEAAAMYCRVESEERFLRGEELRFDIVHRQPGTKFMVMDCGGGTVDITVYEVNKGDPCMLKELHHPSGGDWGGTKVDDAFLDFLYDFLGRRNMAAVNQAHLHQLDRELEQCKRSFRPGRSAVLQVPDSIAKLFKKANFKKFPKVIVQADRLSIDPETFRSFFTPTVDAILDHVRGLLCDEKVKGVKTIVMVGGFSQCQLLHDAVSKAFSDVTVVLPDKAEASVLMGAVLYRHEPNVIGWRVSVFTYGVLVNEPFVKGKHDPSKKWVSEDGKALCKDFFYKVITSGEVVPVGKKFQVFTGHPSLKAQESILFRIFCSRNPDVTYTTEPGCQEIGSLTVHYKTRLPDQRKRKDEMWFEVGLTELKVKVKDTITGEVFEAECDFLSK